MQVAAVPAGAAGPVRARDGRGLPRHAGGLRDVVDHLSAEQYQVLAELRTRRRVVAVSDRSSFRPDGSGRSWGRSKSQKMNDTRRIQVAGGPKRESLEEAAARAQPKRVRKRNRFGEAVYVPIRPKRRHGAATARPNGARTRRSEGGLKWAAEELRPDNSRLTPRQRSRLPRYLKIPLREAPRRVEGRLFG